MKDIINFFLNLRNTLPTISVIDVIDILLVTVIIYQVIALIRTSTASRIAKAIVIMLFLTFVTELLNLHTVNYLLDKILELGFVALVIVFQPELRRLLERLGGSNLRELITKPQSLDKGEEEAIEQIAQACSTMAAEKVGALIVFERSNSLEQICATGTRVDAAVSQELVRNIFFPKAALHDGAMIIRSGRVEAAGCVLPLSENRSLSTDLGTRHRAGVGMSESSDAVVVIVSEETGTISVAIDGMLKRRLSNESLQKLLTRELINHTENRNVVGRIKRLVKGGKTDDSGT